MRRTFKGNAVQTTVVGNISSSVTQITVADGSTYPDGSLGPFFVVLDKGLVGEEKVLVTTRVGNVFTVVTRGQDDQSASAHNSGATVNHVFTKTDADEANAHVNASSGVHGLAGAVVGTTDTQTLSGKTLTSPTVTGTVAGGATYTSPVLNTPTVNGSGGALALPAGPDTLVGRATTDTLTNKTLTSPVINGGTLDAASTIGGVSGTTISADHAAWASYTPSWTTTGTAPSIGNGSIVGYSKQVGKTLFLKIQLAIGSTTSVGTGLWSFSLPGAATATSAIDQLVPSTFTNNTTTFGCYGIVPASGTTVQPYIVGGSATPTQRAVVGIPGTWTGGDRYLLTGAIEVQ